MPDVTTGTFDYPGLFAALKRLMDDYAAGLANVPFASPERQALSKMDGTPENIAAAVEVAVGSSLELNRLFSELSDGMLVVDSQGIAVRVNKAGAEDLELLAEQVLDRSVFDLEREGHFLSAVHARLLREKSQRTYLQTRNGLEESSVTVTPVLDAHGQVFRSVSSSRRLADITAGIKYNRETTDHRQERNQMFPHDTAIIGNSELMRQVLDTANQIKDVDSNILITGETGVGKGLLTRYIHEKSYRHSEKLIEINCGAIPESLLESELFGYEGGAFTGADKRGKPGLIELADRGTVFFDEISELPLLLQVKILSFLQSKRIIRVGGTKNIQIDARVIAASNKDLAQLVREGKFRVDLYYRLNVVQIDMPPLRARGHDILLAAEYFLDRFEKKYHRQCKLDDALRHDLLSYAWPGNLRELENFIERFVVTGQRRVGDICDINSAPAVPPLSTAPPAAPSPAPPAELTLAELLEQTEAKAIRHAYERYRSSYKVAKYLGISQTNAHRKIAKYINK